MDMLPNVVNNCGDINFNNCIQFSSVYVRVLHDLYHTPCTCTIMYYVYTVYSFIQIFHIYEQIFLAIDQRGSDN